MIDRADIAFELAKKFNESAKGGYGEDCGGEHFFGELIRQNSLDESVGQRLDDLSKLVRKFVFDHFLEKASPPVLEEIMRRFTLSREQAFAVLKELEATRHLALVKGTQRILMAYPFSGIPTPFKVTLRNNRKYFANCAWDSVAFHVMLGEDLRIDSFCHHCAEEVRIALSNHRASLLSPEGVVAYVGLPASKWWDDIIGTCSNNMTFFSYRNHVNEWLRANPSQRGESLTVDETVRLSIPIYKNKMKLDYTRPSREDLLAHFESLGLRGDFWTL